MDKYLDNLVQNKKVNLIELYFGDKFTQSIFKTKRISLDSVVKLFPNTKILQQKVKTYQTGNKFKQGNKYFKKVQIEDTTNSIQKNVFTIDDNLDTFIILFSYTVINESDFPCKMEYTRELTQSIITIDYIETIKIKIIDEKYLHLEVLKDAYIDNTLRELNNVLKILKDVFIDSNDN